MTALPTVPSATLAAGDQLTSTWVDQVGAWIAFLSDPPRFRGFQSAPTTVATSVATAIALNSESYDTVGGHDLVTNNSRYTAVYPGRYLVRAQIDCGTNATSALRTAWLRVNGTTFVANGSSTAQQIDSEQCLTVVEEVFLNVGDYIEMGLTQATGATITLGPNVSLMTRWMGSA